MNPSGLGVTNRPAAEHPTSRPDGAKPSAGWRGKLEANRKVALLGLAVAVLAAGGGATMLLIGGGTDPDLRRPAPGASGPPAAAATPGTGVPPTSTASASATSASAPSGTRNPFKPRPTGSASVSQAPTAASTPVVTTTVTDPAVYLALFSVAADGTARFSLNGTAYTQQPGDSFGPTKALTYHKKTTVAGVGCVSVSYVDQSYTVCPGEMPQVG